MKTALVSGCFLEGKDAIGNDRFIRNIRYLRYYKEIQAQLGFDDILLIDNGSDVSLINHLFTVAYENKISLFVKRYAQSLIRGPGLHDYPYCWRALWTLSEFMNSYDKFMMIDSDGFVLTHDLANYLKDLNSGWTSFWSDTWDFPEASMHILCKDAYPLASNYFATPWEQKVGTLMETDLPFTHVERKFLCGRFGEIGMPPQNKDMDFYGQAPLDLKLEFGKYR